MRHHAMGVWRCKSLLNRKAPLLQEVVVLLARWRDLRARGGEAEAEALLPQLLLSVNAIAAGLGVTG